MSEMADPIVTLRSLQQALNDGLPAHLIDLDASYKMYYNEFGEGLKRYIFVKIVGNEAQVISIFGLEGPINGVACWNVSYAVNENCRGYGLAVEAVNKGIERLKSDFARTDVKSFYVEAVIDRKNTPSLKVAGKLFSGSGEAIVETYSEKPSLQFKKLIVLQRL
jgi:hypothetical protein